MAIVRTLILVVLAALALAACGGGPPVAFGALPQFPEATELQTGQNTIADTVAETMKGAVENLDSEIKLYQLPAGTEFADIQEFYTSSLAGDWEPASELTTDAGTFSTAGWQRGSLASEQVLMLGYMPEMLGQQPVLIVSLFSE